MQTGYGKMALEEYAPGKVRMVQGGVVGTRPQKSAREIAGSSPAPVPTGPWLSIVVIGDPMGKPRMTQRDTWKERACVIRYRDWCDQIRQVAGWAKKDRLLEPTRLLVRAHFAIPSSWSEHIKAQAKGAPHQHKPDIDNICKGVLDALIENDERVYKIECEKYWDNGSGPCTEIYLASWEGPCLTTST